jgi:hypothetical protein
MFDAQGQQRLLELSVAQQLIVLPLGGSNAACMWASWRTM